MFTHPLPRITKMRRQPLSVGPSHTCHKSKHQPPLLLNPNSQVCPKSRLYIRTYRHRCLQSIRRLLWIRYIQWSRPSRTSSTSKIRTILLTGGGGIHRTGQSKASNRTAHLGVPACRCCSHPMIRRGTRPGNRAGCACAGHLQGIMGTLNPVIFYTQINVNWLFLKASAESGGCQWSVVGVAKSAPHCRPSIIISAHESSGPSDAEMSSVYKLN